MKDQCHFIGIGGIGMSGLAKLMLGKNIKVSGSDIVKNTVIDNLEKFGAEVHVGHDAKHIKDSMTVVYSSSIETNNPEFLAAQKLNCQMLHRSDLLAALMQGSQVLAVTGTHGKTTTTSLLACVLHKAGLDPSFAVGGIVKEFQTNASQGKGDLFVAEADESDGSFLKYNPFGAIVTSIGRDHMDHFGNRENLIDAFKTFLGNVTSKSHLFWCGDNKYLKQMNPSGYSYGFCESCKLRAVNFLQKGWKSFFDVDFEGKQYRNVEVNLVGAHNALNALAVFGLALKLGVKEDVIREALKSFQGVCRRCEFKGEEQGVLVLDDYAHHPTEISVTLHAIRQAIEERRLIVVYQPHRYSRTKDCLGSFAGIFDEADQVLITEIYSAGELSHGSVSHEDIMEEHSQVSDVPIEHVPYNKLVQTLTAMVRPHDVVVTVGAGDVTKIGSQLIDSLKKKG